VVITALQVMDAADLGPIAVGFTAVIQFVWAVYLMLTEDGTEGTSTGSSFSNDESSSLCLDRACEQDVFKFLNARVLQSATFQVFFFVCYLVLNASSCMF
jgi:nuclear pore complex protein Nup205